MAYKTLLLQHNNLLLNLKITKTQDLPPQYVKDLYLQKKKMLGEGRIHLNILQGMDQIDRQVQYIEDLRPMLITIDIHPHLDTLHPQDMIIITALPINTIDTKGMHLHRLMIFMISVEQENMGIHIEKAMALLEMEVMHQGITDIQMMVLTIEMIIEIEGGDMVIEDVVEDMDTTSSTLTKEKITTTMNTILNIIIGETLTMKALVVTKK